MCKVFVAQIQNLLNWKVVVDGVRMKSVFVAVEYFNFELFFFFRVLFFFFIELHKAFLKVNGFSFFSKSHSDDKVIFLYSYCLLNIQCLCIFSAKL